MKEFDQFRLLRWLLLLWVSFVAFWGLLGGNSGQYGSWCRTTLLLYPASSLYVIPTAGQIANTLLPKVFFLLLIATHGFLLWAGLKGKIPSRLYWLYFPLQGVLVLTASLLVQQADIALNLYLALTLGAVVMLRQIRAITAVATGYIILFVFCTFLSFTPWYNWKLPWNLINMNTLLWNFWDTSNSMMLILFVIGFLMLYRQQVQSHTQLSIAHQQLKLSAEQIEELTRLAERQRLARELHDTLAQGIAGMIMQIQVVKTNMVLHSYERAQQVVDQTMSTARSMLSNARRAIDNLRSTYSDFKSFIEVIEAEIQSFISTTGIDCSFYGQEILISLPLSTHEHVIRMLHEALNNISRHADATRVWIRCEQQNNLLIIDVEDNGHGFEPDAVKLQEGHYGLLGLRERARLIGGTLRVISTPGQGTIIHISLLNSEQEAQDE